MRDLPSIDPPLREPSPVEFVPSPVVEPADDAAPRPIPAADRGKKARRYCWTLPNYTEDDCEAIGRLCDGPNFKYVCYGREIAPTTGTPHLQGYLEIKNPSTTGNIQNQLRAAGCRGMTLLYANGTAQDNMDYCGKEGELVEFGTRPKGQGKRTDLDSVSDLIKSGGNYKAVAEQFPVAFIKYNRGIQALIAAMAPYRDFKTRVYWIYGPTGVGKSRTCWNIAGIANGYPKNSRTKWWDGYLNQPCVIMDDYRPNKEMGFDYLLNLFDRYPMNVEFKGGTMSFLGRVIFVTSPMTVRDMWKDCEWIGQEAIEQMERRVCQIEFNGRDQGTILKTMIMSQEGEHSWPLQTENPEEEG